MSATLFNGQTTDNYDIACFLMMMQERDYDIEETKSMIKVGRMTDPMRGPEFWDEVERLIAA